MTEIILYKKDYCPYCTMAVELLKSKGVDMDKVIEKNIEGSMTLIKEMMEKSGGRRTVPQIFINGEHIGGFDDLSALDNKGELNKKLGLE